MPLSEGHKERFLAELAELCRQRSVAARGEGMEECALLVKEMLGRRGVEARVVGTEGFPVVFGELRGASPRSLLFYNHYDVQPPEPLEAWTSPPFEPQVREGKFFARGAADNKGSFLARLHALDLLREEGEVPLTLKFLVEGEEEIGSPSLRGFVERHAEWLRAEGCLWETSYRDERDRPVLVAGAGKGICYLELTCRGASRDLHAHYGTLVKNPVWRLVWALREIKNEKEEILVEGFYDDVLPPAEEELDALRRVPFDGEALRGHFGAGPFLLGLDGTEALLRHVLSPHCTLCGIEAGYTGEGAKLVLPSEARAKLAFHLVPEQEPSEVAAKVRRHLARRGFGDVEVRLLSRRLEKVRPARTPLSARIVRVAVEAVRAASGREPVVFPRFSEVGPRHLVAEELGVPTVGFGVGFMGSNEHAPDECIRLEDYFEGVEVVREIIRRF